MVGVPGGFAHLGRYRRGERLDGLQRMQKWKRPIEWVVYRMTGSQQHGHGLADGTPDPQQHGCQ